MSSNILIPLGFILLCTSCDAADTGQSPSQNNNLMTESNKPIPRFRRRISNRDWCHICGRVIGTMLAPEFGIGSAGGYIMGDIIADEMDFHRKRRDTKFVEKLISCKIFNC